MKTIWKYTLNLATLPQMIEMPFGAQLLDMQMQNGEMQLWALVDPTHIKTNRKFVTYMTGGTLPDNPGKYLGTVQRFDGALIYHMFELESNA